MKRTFVLLALALHYAVIPSQAQEKVTVGQQIGSDWEGLPVINQAVVPQQPPSTALGPAPNYSKYPIVAGAAEGAFTKNFLQDLTLGARSPLRSWLGWFVWGDGMTPPGINPGIFASADGYGKYAGTGWDFFNFQWPKTGGKSVGAWNPIRLDQQPLYLTPLVLNYNWAPGLFGYESAPLANFPRNTFYMGGRVAGKDNQTPKKIVRGVNVSGAIPFFYQYGDKLSSPIPVPWRQSWLYLATRPLETTVIVPGNVTPAQLVDPPSRSASWVPRKNGSPDPFPYPVWRTGDTPANQTPFAILVDEVGDFHADLIWEATNPREGDYDTHRFYRTDFANVDATKRNPVGRGDYLKMTVAQGSPFIWCESNNNVYATFYNLIRTNLVGQIANNTGTGAGVVLDRFGNPQIYDVPGVKNVSFVLLYGDHVNPNQWYQEELPWYSTIGDGPEDSNLPGGFNPPPLNGTYRTKNNALISTTGQHNYIYTAIYFRPDEVVFTENGKRNIGTDSQGNPYFFLQFKTFLQNGEPTAGKNWFVLGSVPEMRYYGVVPDAVTRRLNAAVDWAQRMGRFAFNFVTDSHIDYTVTNMYQVQTAYRLSLTNPYTRLPASAKPANANAMTDPGTIVALQPHQYQPITLGPDYTKPNKVQVVWNPLDLLENPGVTIFQGSNVDLNANKNVTSGKEFWDYWSIRGSMETVRTTSGAFTTTYPFQNFLPVMPPPKFERTFDQTGIPALNIVNTGSDYRNITSSPNVTITTTVPTPGQDASGQAIVDTTSAKVQQVDVVSGGTDYPNGNPPAGVNVTIDPPPGPGRTATAYPQTSGGSVVAIFMLDQGLGYSPIITVTQSGTNTIDPPIIIPNFNPDGTLKAGPAQVLENGAGFDFSSINQPVATLFAGAGTGATMQIVKPGNILSYTTALSGANGGRYASPNGAPPTGVTVHVTPPSGGPAQQAQPQFSRITQPAPPPKITNQGLYSDNTGVIANYTNAEGKKSSNLPITWAPSGANFVVSALGAGDVSVDAPAQVEFTGGTFTTKAEAVVNPLYDNQPVVTNGGVYSSTAGVTAHFIDDSGATINLTPTFAGAAPNFFVNSVGGSAPAWITTSKPITFSGGTFTTQAAGTVYPAFSISSLVSGTNLVGGYESEVQVAFTGGDFSTDPNVRIPQIRIKSLGTPGTKRTIETTDLEVLDAGKGLPGNTVTFAIEGGLGFDAVLDPIVGTTGQILAVRVLRPGSNYLPDGKVFAWVNGGGGSGAVLKVVVANDRSIAEVKVENGGSGYTSKPSVQLTSKPPPYPPNPDPVFQDNPKGVQSRFNAAVANGSIQPVSPFIKLPINTPGDVYAPYYAGAESQATTFSTPAAVTFLAPAAFATHNSAALWLASPAPTKTLVEQVLYSSVISQYFTLSTEGVAPFGGAYLGASAPDGYGLGGQLAGAARFIGDIYNMQQKYKTVPPSIPSPYAVNAGGTPFFASGNKTWNFPVQKDNNPYVSLTAALKTSVQSLQRSISLLFLDPPSSNAPDSGSPNVWKMDYFGLFDPGVGRIVINPTATQPAWGVNSSTDKPGDIPPAENDPKKGLSKWEKGMLWSGFGVSDQWNDQHYFYGYYLGSAALAGLFDRAWSDQPSVTGSAPDKLWAGKTQMGTALDQLLLTLAYNPSKAELQDPDKGYYRVPQFAYQKFAFFDQWNGHPWASGATPGTTVAVLDFASDPFGYWRSFGTDSDKYNGENENSIFEGIQAWSSTILWGGATDRKAIVDLGIYLYSTNLAAADAYFLDKNYNLTDIARYLRAGNQNYTQYSWVPVTTIDANLVPKNGNNDEARWNAGADYGSANPLAFFQAPDHFADRIGNVASPGQSLLKKAENTLNNFFYSYPTGSKFIQAYPPAPWTMGMARNTNFMKKWAGAMMQDDWNDARNSALYQAADWNAMALTSALVGVPYNPGDIPFPTEKTPNPKKVDKYLPRLWSSWVTSDARPGSRAALNPPFLANSVLTFLLALEDYGTPDWTYIGVATSSSGAEDPNSVVFTAAFTKEPQPKDTSVQTTFVAFNPGWNTRYAKFQRLNATGGIRPANVSGVLTMKPKQTIVKTVTFKIDN